MDLSACNGRAQNICPGRGKGASSFPREQMSIHLILNAYWELLDFELPLLDTGGENPWRRWIDTALESPHDIVPWQTTPAVSGSTYRAEARAVVALFARGYARRAVS